MRRHASSPQRLPVLFLACVAVIASPSDGTAAVRSQVALPQMRSARSQSGQFTVNAPELSAPAAGSASDPDLVQLDPPSLSVSCERIKEILYRDLGATSPWRGKIYVVLHPRGELDGMVTITAQHFRDGWQYRLDLPQQMERARFVRAMVQVLLLEMANRSAGERSAEVPPWLIEGFTEQLLASSELAIILPPPRNLDQVSYLATNIKARRENPLEQARTVLAAGVPLTFEQMSWPAEENLNGAGGQLYLSSVQLFVQELLRLKDGPACLRDMLGQLPQHLNWQFAFLRGFHRWFGSALEVEKWWALRVVHFTGRDLAQIWPWEESWDKLNVIVHAAVQIRVGTNELPLQAQVSLQTILREWDHEAQRQTLQTKVGELKLMRQRVPQPMLALVDDYRLTIEDYLREQDKGWLPFLRKAAWDRAVQRTLVKMEELDTRLFSLRPEIKPVTAKK